MIPLIKIKYLDIVWVKMSTYRWWPSEVTHPTEIPDKLEKMSSGPGEFVIRFLGTNEYYWCNQKRCFPYKGLMADPIAFQNYNNPSLYKTNGENDTTTDQQMKQLIDQMENKKGKSKQNDQFKLALVEAEDLFDTQKGYKSNAGSLPFHKLTVNSYYPRSVSKCRFESYSLEDFLPGPPSIFLLRHGRGSEAVEGRYRLGKI